MTSRRRAAAVVSLLLGGIVVLVPAQSGSAATTRSSHSSTSSSDKFLTANIGSGSECNPGHKGTYKCLKIVNQQIAAFHPDAVSVDEACQSDAAEFRQKNKGWTVAYVADSEHDPSKCGHVGGSTVGQSKGNFVAVPGKVIGHKTFHLRGVPGGVDEIYLGCEQTSAFWICTVHLPFLSSAESKAHPKVHPVEVNEIVMHVLDSLSGKVIVCGDFNMPPTNSAFAPLKSNNFTETDPADKPTLNPTASGTAKFDYIWYHRGGGAKVGSVSAHVIQQPPAHFDHDLLEGRVSW